MYYEINVAKRDEKTNDGSYRHLFATHQRSITTSEKLLEVMKEFTTKFPAPEYDVSVMVNKEVFYGVDLDILFETNGKEDGTEG